MSERVPDQPTCREVVELITDYLEARLPLEARTRLEQHLVFCDWCRVYLEQIRQTIRMAGAASEESFSPEKREELVARLSRARRSVHPAAPATAPRLPTRPTVRGGKRARRNLPGPPREQRPTGHPRASAFP